MERNKKAMSHRPGKETIEKKTNGNSVCEKNITQIGKNIDVLKSKSEMTKERNKGER